MKQKILVAIVVATLAGKPLPATAAGFAAQSFQAGSRPAMTSPVPSTF